MADSFLQLTDRRVLTSSCPRSQAKAYHLAQLAAAGSRACVNGAGGQRQRRCNCADLVKYRLDRAATNLQVEGELGQVPPHKACGK